MRYFLRTGIICKGYKGSAVLEFPVSILVFTNFRPMIPPQNTGKKWFYFIIIAWYDVLWDETMVVPFGFIKIDGLKIELKSPRFWGKT